LFRKNLKKVLYGQAVTTGPASYSVGRRLLEGDALATFNNKATELNAETVANFNVCLDAVAASVFPRRALLLQKRYMRRFLRKPSTMTTREYVARINEINNYLPSFPPTVEGGQAPEKLPADEISDLLEFGVPHSWQREMVIQDFDPLQHTVSDFVAFAERLEQVEATENGAANQRIPKKDKSTKETGKRKRSLTDSMAKRATKNSGKDCLLHGEGCGHSTDQCFTLQAQAKRMKKSYDDDSKKSSSKKSFKKQEIHVLISEAVEKALAAKSSKKSKIKNKKEELKEFSNLSISSNESEGDDKSTASSTAESTDSST
jgi:hypothetical protein